MRFLIAAVLVLNCATAYAGSVVICFADNVMSSPEADGHWQELVTSLKDALAGRGYIPITSMPEHAKAKQLAAQIVHKTDGKTPMGVNVVLVNEDGKVVSMGTLPFRPRSKWDPDWTARSLIELLKL